MSFIVLHTIDSDHHFLKSAEYGHLKTYPKVKFCLIHYDNKHYQDTLFQRWDIPLPKALDRAVDKRKAEYLAGRYCATFLLKQFGFQYYNIISDCYRVPIWPRNISASISHIDTHAIALAGNCEQENLIIGVDIEILIQPSVLLEIKNMVVNDREYSIIQNSALGLSPAFTLSFSIKESIFKAIFPEIKQNLDFNVFEVKDIQENSNTIIVVLNCSLSHKYQKGSLFVGQFIVAEDFVCTMLVSHSN